jgi:hypothetical protein
LAIQSSKNQAASQCTSSLSFLPVKQLAALTQSCISSGSEVHFCQALQVLKHHEYSGDKVKAKEAWLSNIQVNPLQPLEVVKEVPSKEASV